MKIILLLSTLIFVLNCFAVSVPLQLSEKSFMVIAKEVQITMASEEGSKEELDYQKLVGSDYLCFLVESNTHNDFGDKDVKLIQNIKISQSNQEIAQSMHETKKNNSGKITAVLLKYLKSDLLLYAEMQFKMDMYSSNKFNIDERFLSEYCQYKPFYDQGNTELENLDYLQCYRQLAAFTDSSATLKSLSFYKEARKNLDFAVQQQVSRIESDYNFMILISTESVSRDILNSIDSLKVFTLMCDSLFAEYTAKIDSEPHENMIQLTNQMEELFSSKYTIFLQQIYEDFTHYDYRSAKFTNFMGALTEVLTSEENCLRLTDPILDIKLIPEDSEFLIKIDNFNYRKDFEEFLGYISNDVINNSYIFDDQILLKLQNLQEEEPEPYYNIYKGINHLFNSRYQEFETNMVKAMAKCTGSHLLRGIELTLLFNDQYLSSLSTSERGKFEQGLQGYSSGNIADAIQQFELLKNLYPDIAASYYLLAELAIKAEDEFTAFFEYENVVKYKPEIISVYVYLVKQDIKAGSFESAKDKVTINLNSHPAWQLYFLLARVQMALENYNEAIDTLENYCIKTNKYNYDEYILLGDIYLKLANQEKARINFMEAGRLDSSDPLFRERLRALD